MGEKIDTTQIQLNVGNKPHIVLLKEYGLECYSLSLMNPHCEFGDLKLWSSLSLFSWSLPAGRPFFFFLLDSSMPPFSEGCWGDLWDMTGVFILKGHIYGYDKIKDI